MHTAYRPTSQTSVPTLQMSRRKIESLRGRLIAHLQRGVSWKEFAKLCNTTPQTLRNIRTGRTAGSLETANAILAALAAQGLHVDPEDLLTLN